MNASSSAGGDTGLARLARQVDLDQDAQARAGELAVALELAQRGVRGDGVDQTDMRNDQPHAPALQLTDEVPLEQLSMRGRLGLEVLGAVSPTSPMPASARTGRSPTATYLVAASTSTCTLPRPARAPADREAAAGSPRAGVRGSQRSRPPQGRRSAQPRHSRLAPRPVAFASV